MTENVKKPVALFGGRGVNAGIAVCGVLALIGFGLWIWQLNQGLVVSNMRNLSSWGLYITTFMFLVGLSAGGLIISSAPRVLGVEGFGGISKIAVWTSICCTVLAVAMVVIDLGQPLRLWELFVYSNLTSPLLWDIVVISTYLIISVAYLVLTLRVERGRGSAKALRVLSAFALVTAVLVHSVTAWIFGLQVGRGMWHTALLAPWFVSSALVCGVALVLVVVIALRRAGYLQLAQENVVKMLKLLGIFVCVDLYFFGCDLLTEGYAGGEGVNIVAMLVTGPLAPYFWVEVLGCVFTAVVAFVPKLRTNPLIVVASVLAIVGIFCKRVQLLVGGFQLPNLEYAVNPLPGSPLTDLGAVTQGLGGMVYFPALPEFAIVVGMFGFGGLLLLLGLKYLPLAPREQS